MNLNILSKGHILKNSFELFSFLKTTINLGDKNSWWWENHGSFEILIGAILTQRTKWENVVLAINNLKNANLLDEQNIANLAQNTLANLIKPSGFYNQKAKVLSKFCQNLVGDFESFANFKQNATRDWLLCQKGIGFESADAILNYALLQEAMVVDSYTAKLLRHFGYEFQSYDELQEWLKDGITSSFDKVQESYGFDISLAQTYARFHGKIVMFCKDNLKKDGFVNLPQEL